METACTANGYSGSGAFDSSDTDFFGDFAGLKIAPAGAATDALVYVPANCGIGRF